MDFVYESDDNTNKIKDLWSHLKLEMRTRHGIIYNFLRHIWLSFSVKKVFCKKKFSYNLSICFEKLLCEPFGNDLKFEYFFAIFFLIIFYNNYKFKKTIRQDSSVKPKNRKTPLIQ